MTFWAADEKVTGDADNPSCRACWRLGVHSPVFKITDLILMVALGNYLTRGK